MNSILEELYFGNIRSPFARRSDKDSEEGALYEKYDRRLIKLLNELPRDYQKEFEAFAVTEQELLTCTESSAFAFGFRLGMLLTTEVYRDEDFLDSDI